MTYVPASRPPTLRRDPPPAAQWQSARAWSPPPVHLPLVTRDRSGLGGFVLILVACAVAAVLHAFGVL